MGPDVSNFHSWGVKVIYQAQVINPFGIMLWNMRALVNCHWSDNNTILVDGIRDATPLDAIMF